MPTGDATRLTIGIWCKYHVTLEPSEGIGVFAHNLALGLASIPDGPNVMLAIREGDESAVKETVVAGNGRICALSPKALGWPRDKARKLNKMINRWHWKRQAKQTLAMLPNRLQAPIPPRASRSQPSFWERAMGSVLPDEAQLMGGCCDAWIVPYVGLDVAFAGPTVAVIHDLVPVHFPGAMDQRGVTSFFAKARRLAERSTIVACMSNFIRKNDLEGVLELPAGKVRVVEPAAPLNFGTTGDENETIGMYPVLKEQFIFYPAAFRDYKNHRLLVEALRLLHDRGGQRFHLVFTGITAAPDSLKSLIAQSNLQDHVCVLEKVPRHELSIFYRRAQATIVPSLYEQGSFPLMEAIHWKCPVACSRIESLVELFTPMGESMLYFDPNSPVELADVMQNLGANRQRILQAQQSASKQMFSRTWTDASRDWLAVAEEAIDLHHGRNRVKGYRDLERQSA